MGDRILHWVYMLAIVLLSVYVVTATHKNMFDCTFEDNDWCILQPASNDTSWLVESGELRLTFTDTQAVDTLDRMFYTTDSFPPGDYCLKVEHKISEGARLIISAQEVGGDVEISKQWDSKGQVTSFTRWVKFVQSLSVTTKNNFLLSFTGVKDSGYTGVLIMLERIHLYNGICDDVNNLDSCEFNGHLCELTAQSGSSGLQWTIDDGVDSRNAGPTNDHTDSDNGYFVSTGSRGYNKGDKATLYSPWYEVDTSGLCVELWYFMYGSTVGELNIQVVGRNSISTKIWSRHGQQQEKWIKASILYPVPQDGGLHEYQVIVQAVQGANEGGTGDGTIAIDDYRVDHCNFYSTSKTLSCGFDYSFCRWSNLPTLQSPEFQWSRKNTDQDGPNYVLGKESSAFAYKVNESQKATELVSRAITESFCMTFYYKMLADDDDSELTIYVENETTGGTEELWSIRGNQGTDWLKARVGFEVQPQSQYKVRIRADFREEFRASIIAVDDISAFDYTEKCLTMPEEAVPEELRAVDDEKLAKSKRWILPTAIGIVAVAFMLAVIVMVVARRKEASSRCCATRNELELGVTQFNDNSLNDFAADRMRGKVDPLGESPFEAMPLTKSADEEYYTEPNEAIHYYSEPKETTEYYTVMDGTSEYYTKSAAFQASPPTRDLPNPPFGYGPKDQINSGYQNLPAKPSAGDTEYIEILS